MKPDRLSFFQTWSKELDARANQVRQLIGNKHWLSDGHHKEALLRDVVQRSLPAGVHADRGFVIGLSWPDDCSKEQDVMVYDSSIEAPLFSHSGLTIALAEHVLAVVSVKTAFAKDELTDSVSGLTSVANLREIGSPLPLAAMYFFDGEPSITPTSTSISSKVAEWMQPFGVSALRRAKEWRIRVASDWLACIDFPNDDAARVRVCKIPNTTTAVFLATIVDSVAHERHRRRSVLADALDAAIGELGSDFSETWIR